jgi:hypothetical protein
MSQTSLFDAEYADKRKRIRHEALLMPSKPAHPNDASALARPHQTGLQRVTQEHCSGAFAVCALSNLWMARRWLAWAGEVCL